MHHSKSYSPQEWKKQPRENDPNGRGFFGMKKRKPKASKKISIKKLFLLFVKLSITGFALMVLGVGIFVALISRDLPSPDKIIERSVPLSTKIYDRKEETVLFNIHGNQKRTLVALEKIPKHIIEATLTAEDRHFYNHKGISFRGIARSLFRNITSGSKAGGSTLTQQFIKNAVLSPEKTYTRKIKEVILSYRLEKKFSKEEILQMYFNEIPYGSTAYGVSAAAQTYFAKDVTEISLAEGAVLAALPQAPSYYSPFGNNKDRLIIRQQWILNDMAELGYITKEEAEIAKEEDLVFKQISDDIIAPHFVMYVREYLSQKYGEKTVEQDGLRVVTTLDLEKQILAEEAIASQVEKNMELGATNAALVAIDTKSGQILAMVGSKDFFDKEIDGQVNVTTRPRQPGSSFKPIVYTAAFVKGYTPDTVLYDVETTFTNYDLKPYAPKNYTLTEHGAVTIRKAFAGSLNIPAVKTIYLTGVDKVLDVADALGYTTLKERSRFGLALVLGGGEVKLVEHVNAFATLAQEGVRPTIASIVRVEDKDGNVLEEYKEERTKVLDKEIARQVVDIMSDNEARTYSFGAVNPLTLPGRAVAAKTGTTNDFRDAWTVGFTPSLAAGVWVGNNDFSEMKTGAAGATVAGPIWNTFMRTALEGEPVERFTKPKTITTNNPALDGSFAEGVKVKIDTVSGKLATEHTPEELILEKTFSLAHSILHFVNKDNPRGAQPQTPETDPQYAVWEEAIKAWALKNEITLDEAPTESDDVHVPENKPSLTILFPLENQEFVDRAISAEVHASARLGIRKVEYYLNGKLIRTALVRPHKLKITLNDPSIQNGFATLTVKAYDVAQNKTEKSVRVLLSLPELPSRVALTEPQTGALLSQDSFPLAVELDIKGSEYVRRITLVVNDGVEDQRHLHSFTNINTAKRLFEWATYPGPAQVELYAIVENNDGVLYETDRVLLEVK